MKATKDQFTKKEDVLRVALGKLEKELTAEPFIEPERVLTLLKVVEVLGSIQVEAKVAEPERQLQDQPDIEQISKDLANRIHQQRFDAKEHGSF